MKRSYAWTTLSAMLLSSSLAHAQYYPNAAPPYANGAPYGYAPMSSNSMPSGLQQAGGPAPGNAGQDDLISRVTYLNTMQMMSGGNVPAAMPGWDTLTLPPQGNLPTTPPISQAPPEYVYVPADQDVCLPSSSPDPQVPIQARHPGHDQPVHLPRPVNPNNPVRLCDKLWCFCSNFDGSALPELIYRSWALNLIWKTSFDSLPDPGYRSWIDLEYLSLRTKSAPVSVPLVSGNPNPAAIGALGEPGTTVLFGAGNAQSTDFPMAGGGRLTIGCFLNDNSPCGVEASGFLMEKRAMEFNAASFGGNTPIVSVPFFATQPFNFVNGVGETSLNANGAANQVNVHFDTRLWGVETNAIVDLLPQEYAGCLRLLALVGFRYLDLSEGFSLTDTFQDPSRLGSIVVNDSFSARNQFFGGQVGLRASLLLGRWTVDASGKLALGANHQTIDIGGSTTVKNGAFGFASATTAGGVFAEPSNGGRSSRNAFAIAPEAQLKVFYELTQSIRPFVGYNFLYLDGALRPANQLDRNINPTQNAFFVPAGNPVTSPAAPSPTFRSTDFWAQGLNLGLELRY